MKIIYSKVIIIFLFCLIGILFHWLPNLGTPLHSDTAWIFLLQVSDNEELKKTIPIGLKSMTAYPSDFFSAARDWYQKTVRINFLTLFSFRFLAKTAGQNANMWRLFNILALSISIGILCLLCIEFGINRNISFLLSISLFFYPLYTWIGQPTSEPMGIPFLMLAFYFEIRAKNVWMSILSACCMLIAIFFKEPFALFWAMILGIIYWRDFEKLKLDSLIQRIYKIVRQFIPHIIVIVSLIIFIVIMKVTIPLKSDYVFFSPIKDFSLFKFWVLYIAQIMPRFFGDIRLHVLLYTLFIVSVFSYFVYRYFFISKNETQKFIENIFNGKRIILLSFLLVGIILHTVPYVMSSRIIANHYLFPANFLFVVFIGIIISYIYENFKEKRFFTKRLGKMAIVFLVTVALFSQIDKILHYAAQYRINNTTWNKLIYQIKNNAYQGTHVALKFQEPLMIETAQSLQANTILLGRYDLTYHLAFETGQDQIEKSELMKKMIDSFNADGKDFSNLSDRNILYVVADRKGKQISDFKFITPSILIRDIKLLFTKPNKLYYERYYSTKMPYLNYEISLNKPL